MVDQVTSLRKRSVYCSIVASGDGMERNLLATDSSLSTDSLLFVTPEALVRSRWRYSIDDPEVSQRIVAIVVDEAHCVSKWQVTLMHVISIHFSNKCEMLFIMILYMYTNCVVNSFFPV